MTFHEYPKALYLRGWDDLDACVTVHSVEQEEEARADGYRMLSEPVADFAALQAVSARIEAEVIAQYADAPKRRGRPPKAVSE
jgi:hypothetical protein